MKSRRQFLLQSIPAAFSIGIALKANAQATKIDEADTSAKALGYKHDASKINSKEYPTYSAEKNCANCMFYKGKASDSWASCSALRGKQVNAKGWCIAWAKQT